MSSKIRSRSGIIGSRRNNNNNVNINNGISIANGDGSYSSLSSQNKNLSQSQQLQRRDGLNSHDHSKGRYHHHHYQQQQQQPNIIGYSDNHNCKQHRPRWYYYYHGKWFKKGFLWTNLHRIQLQFYKYIKGGKHYSSSVLNILLIACALVFSSTILYCSGAGSLFYSLSSKLQHRPLQLQKQAVLLLEEQQRAPSRVMKRFLGPKRTKFVERPILYNTPRSTQQDPPILQSWLVADTATNKNGNQQKDDATVFHPMPQALISSPQPDYGDLKMTFLDQGERRIIHPDPMALHGHVWTEDEYEDEGWDEYYSFDDDFQRNLPFKEINKTCRRVSFHRNYFPNCNLFHEIEIMKGTNKYLGSGAYREAYLQHETFDPQLVVKVQRFRKNPFTYDRYEFIRMDALVMERLTASPRIADIYGHCATSVYSEFLPDEAEERFIPGDGDGSDLNDKDDVDPKNNFTISEKLDLTLQMAESIADLHGYKYGVIVHDDIQLAQYLFAPDGRLKLNDFNRAEAMLFDEEDGSYCRYQNGKGAGDYRAPEEYKDGWLNEKIDIWSFGNNIYALITGLWVFYDEGNTKVKQKKLLDGEIAYLDPRYKGRNYILDRLIELMYRCWVYEPDDRIDIFGSVSFLRETLKEAKKRNIYDGRF